jgi:stress response protein SCP2
VSTLTAGMNTPVRVPGPFALVLSHRARAEQDLDVNKVNLTGFVLTSQGSVPNGDGDIVFYNQPGSLGSLGAQWVPPTKQGEVATHTIWMDPSRWASGVGRVRVALTVEGATIGALHDLTAVLYDSGNNVVATFDLSDRDPANNALIVAELYLHGGQLKVRCVCAGFNDGLDGLCHDVGIETEEQHPAAQVPAAPPVAVAPPAPETPQAKRANLVKAVAATPPPATASPVDMRKYTLATVIVKNKLTGRIFRVVLLIDASGSMDWSGMYKKRGKRPSIVQCSLERMVTIADLFDDNNELEVWYFGTKPSRARSVTVATMHDYVEDTWAAKRAAGGSNDEPLVMAEVLKWIDDNPPSPYPTMVLAWSDGGVGRREQIERILRESSHRPIVWVWLGLGGSPSSYGVLADFDNLSGLFVDHCGFIPIDDIEKMSDEVLYQAIMAIVAKWVTQAVDKGIIPREPATVV